MSKTRDKILDAALALFAINGCSGTTVRMISDKSGITLGALTYHFKSKEALYLEVVVSYCTKLHTSVDSFDPAYDELLLPENIANEQLVKMIETMVVGFMKKLLATDNSRYFALIMMREQANPTKAFDIIYNSFMSKTHKKMAWLIARIEKSTKITTEHYFIAHSFIGQVLAFIVAKEGIFRSAGIKEYSANHIELIASIIRKNIKSVMSPGLSGD